MKFETQYLGKWVAAKNNKVIAAGATLTKVKKKIGSDENLEKIKFVLIPKGYIAG